MVVSFNQEISYSEQTFLIDKNHMQNDLLHLVMDVVIVQFDFLSICLCYATSYYYLLSV